MPTFHLVKAIGIGPSDTLELGPTSGSQLNPNGQRLAGSLSLRGPELRAQSLPVTSSRIAHEGRCMLQALYTSTQVTSRGSAIPVGTVCN